MSDVSIIDKIKAHPNNDPMEIIRTILDNGFDVKKGLVYSINDTTIVKTMKIRPELDIEEAVVRVNNAVPGFIKDYKIISNTQVDLYITKYKGIHPRPLINIDDKEHALKILDACMSFWFKKIYTYNMTDFCSGNILLDGDEIHIIDLDPVFYGDLEIRSQDVIEKEIYTSMHWLHDYVEFTEFKERWAS